MTNPELLSVVEIANLIAVTLALAIAILSLLDAINDRENRKALGVDGRIMLAGARSFRGALSHTAILTTQLGYFCIVMLNPLVPSRLTPDILDWTGYAARSIIDLWLLYLCFFNYRDYRKALKTIQLDDPVDSVTQITTTQITEEKTSAGVALTPIDSTPATVPAKEE